MVRVAALALCLVGVAAQNASSPEPEPEPEPDSMGSAACSTSYMTAYMATVSGACAVAETCPPQCQSIIDDVQEKCNISTHTYKTTVAETGDAVEKSFVSKAMQSLQLMGPVDCKYDQFEQTASFTCGTHCTRAEVTGQDPNGHYEMHGCLKASGASDALQATWENCGASCRAKFQTLTNECSYCFGNPVVSDFLSQASTQLLKCTVGAAGEGSCSAGLWDGLQRVCCAGTGNGTGSDNDCDLTATPAEKRRYPTCPPGPASQPCQAAVQSAGLLCPESFLVGAASSKMLGMFDECGGSIQQLYASRPSLKTQLLYCDDPSISSKGIAMPAGGAGRRLDADEAERAVLPENHAGVSMDELTGEEPFEERVAAVKRSMHGPLSQLGGQRRRQQSANSNCTQNPLAPGCEQFCKDNPTAAGCPQTSNLTCSMKYQQAFVATINGSCSKSSCGVACQTKITDMLTACKGVTYTEPATAPATTGPTRSFSQKAVVALQYLGPIDCSYSLQVQTCSLTECTIGQAVQSLAPQCATFFMGVDFHGWKPTACADPTSSTSCFSKLANFVGKCQGCTDPFMKTLLSKAAAGEATTCGGDICTDYDEMASSIGTMCCAGPDGMVGNADDLPCNSATVGGTTFYLPTTCTPDSACQIYITGLASKCVSAFLEPSLAGAYADCGGDIQALIGLGKPCQATASQLMPSQHGDAGQCNSSCADANGDGQCTGDEAITMNSGTGCNVRCHTQFCLRPSTYIAGSDAAAQPQCIDGCITNAIGQKFSFSGNDCQGFLATAAPAPPLQCAAVPVSTCNYPANGGCDPASLCNDDTNLFGTALVQCGPCPAGYSGSSRPTDCDSSGIHNAQHCRNGGCVDVNECEQDACDRLTTCTNFAGGYRCGPCPQGYTGDGETGCLLPGQALIVRNASLTAAIAAKKKDLNALLSKCYVAAANMTDAQLTQFGKTQYGPCDTQCAFGCTITLTDDCFYIFPVEQHCTAGTTAPITFYSPQSISAAIEGARLYISKSMVIASTTSSAPPETPCPNAATGDNNDDTMDHAGILSWLSGHGLPFFGPPPPPTPKTSFPCTTLADFAQRTAQVTNECCDELDEDCDDGIPKICNAGCAAILLPMRASCNSGFLASGGPLQAATELLDRAAAQCPRCP